jgi:hypothetical protein
MNIKEEQINFAVCIANAGYEDVEALKVYQVLSDAKAAEVGCLRVIDESGEDYLYPADRFIVLDLLQSERERLLSAIKTDPA